MDETLPYCLISLSSDFLPFSRSAPRGPASNVFLVRLFLAAESVVEIPRSDHSNVPY